MPCHRQLKTSLRQVINSIGHYNGRDATTAQWFVPAPQQLDISRRPYSTAPVAVFADDRDEHDTTHSIPSLTIGHERGQRGKQPSESPRSSSTEGIRIQKHDAKGKARAVETRPTIEYVSAFTNSAKSGMDKQIKLWQIHNERQPDLLVHDFQPMLGLLEDAPCSDAAENTEAETERQRDTIRQEQEWSIDKQDLKELGDVLDDITYAPSRTPVPTRLFWAHRLRQSTEKKIPPRPLQVTSLNVTTYIGVLTEFVPQSGQQNQSGYEASDPAKSHVDVVAEELVSLLTNEKYALVLSDSALEQCLHFFLQHDNFDAIRLVYPQLKHRIPKLNACNFDSLLFAAAEQQSGRDFQYILHDMLSLGVHPTSNTWSAFYTLVCRKFPHRAHHVVRAMQRKGVLLSPGVLQRVIANGVDTGLKGHLAIDGTLDAFIETYESMYGDRRRWLGTTLANRICRVMLKNGQAMDALHISKQMWASLIENGATAIRASTVNTYLVAAFRDRDLKAAVTYLRQLSTISSSRDVQNHTAATIELDQLSYGILFQLAWERRCFNALRVIWRYASTSAQTTVKMQQHMMDSLNASRPGAKANDRKVRKQRLSNKERARMHWQSLNEGQELAQSLNDRPWHVWAAIFAIGVQEGVPRLPIASDPSCIEGERDLAIQASEQESNRWTKSKASIKSLEAVLNRDLMATEFVRPTADFADCLELAWLGDRAWQRKGLGVGAAWGEQMFEEMLRHGVRVPMEMIPGSRAQIRPYYVKGRGSSSP